MNIQILSRATLHRVFIFCLINLQKSSVRKSTRIKVVEKGRKRNVSENHRNRRFDNIEIQSLEMEV